MRSRLGVHIRKVSLIYAATDGAATVELTHLEAAIAFVEWSWTNTRALMRSWGVSVWSQIEAKVERALTEHGCLLRRDLSRKARGRQWSSREISQVIDAMVKNGTVEVNQAGGHKWSI